VGVSGCFTQWPIASSQTPAQASKHGQAPHRVLTGVLLNDLISGGQQRFRDGKAERLGGLEVDDEFDFYHLLHREVGRLVAFEDAP